MITDPSHLPEEAREDYRRGHVETVRVFGDWQSAVLVCPRDGCQSFTPVRLVGDDRDLQLCDSCEHLYEIASDGHAHEVPRGG